MEESTRALLDSLLAGDRLALSRAITLVESSNPSAHDEAQALISQLPTDRKALHLAVTGAPGVGKSTFIDALGTYLTRLQHKVAVLAVDPSSGLSHGSILGDKTRMVRLGRDKNAYVRPSPTGGLLGGIAAATYEAALLCEAAGYDIIIIETVGVGQSEVAVRHLADFFILLLQPAAGDDLQGLKMGIVEEADLLVVNKWDTHLLKEAEKTKAVYQLTRPEGKPEVLLVSSLEDRGFDQLWKTVNLQLEAMDLHEKRSHRQVFWFMESTRRLILRRIIEENTSLFRQMEEDLRSGKRNYANAIDETMKVLCQRHHL